MSHDMPGWHLNWRIIDIYMCEKSYSGPQWESLCANLELWWTFPGLAGLSKLLREFVTHVDVGKELRPTGVHASGDVSVHDSTAKTKKTQKPIPSSLCKIFVPIFVPIFSFQQLWGCPNYLVGSKDNLKRYFCRVMCVESSFPHRSMLGTLQAKNRGYSTSWIVLARYRNVCSVP